MTFKLNTVGDECAVQGCKARCLGGVLLVRLPGLGERTLNVCDEHYRLVIPGERHSAGFSVAVPLVKGPSS